jgi:hypothetical protein
MDTDAPNLMTYKQLAEALGLGSADSARIKARRRGWKVRPGNHPMDPSLVEVPPSALMERRERTPPDKRSAPSGDAMDVRPPIDFQAMAGWQAAIDTQGAEIERLHAMLEAERAERSRLVDAVALANEAMGRMAARQAAVEAERDSAMASLSELKKMTAMLVDRVQGADAAKAEALNAVEELRRSTAKTLIGMQAALRPPKPTA